MQITRTRAAELTQRFQDKRIIVLGDLMLDEFFWGRVRRISPEAPVPVVEIERQTLALGGAGNVASNLVALGAHPVPLGVMGDDADAERLRSAFRALGIRDECLVADASRPTTLKTRIIAHNQQVVRADRESRATLGLQVEASLIQSYRRELEAADAVVVSDYGKGLLTQGVLSAALSAARERKVPVCLDPKSRNFAGYQPVTI